MSNDQATAEFEMVPVTSTKDCEALATRCLASGSYEEAASHFTLALRSPGDACQQAGCHLGRAVCMKQMGLLQLVRAYRSCVMNEIGSQILH
jgi:hypothetical protein